MAVGVAGDGTDQVNQPVVRAGQLQRKQHHEDAQ
jgi:hypothetical protein